MNNIQQININENQNNLHFNNIVEIKNNKENIDISELKEKLNQEKINNNFLITKINELEKK